MIESDFDSLLPGTATVDVTNRRTDLKVALGVGYMPPQLFPSWLKPPSKHPTPADTCRHLPTRCAGGLCAIAPDLYARQGDAKGYKEIAKLMSEVVSKVPDAQVMADLDAAVQWAGKNGGNTKKVADTGFCCGGRIQRTHTQAPSRFCCELERPGVGLVRRRRRRHCAHHGQPTEFVVYRTAPHAFHADYRPSYLNEDAADGFKHAMARFKAHGVA